MSQVESSKACAHGEHLREVRLVKPLQYDFRTPQTDGMRRLGAVSHMLSGSESICAGVMLAEPDSISAVHHHGPLETVVFVVSGQGIVRWGSSLEHEAELEPGDFLFIPPYTPHQEINPSHVDATEWIVVRSGPEAISVRMTLAANGQYVEDASGGSR